MSSIFSKIKKVFNDPRLIVGELNRRGFFKCLSDEAWIKMMFRVRMGRKLNLESPQTYSEKLQWLKLHDRRPEYTEMVDKHEVKAYVARVLGEEYIIPTLGVWDSFDDIDFDKLPKQFVLKCTHDSGGLIVCTDKSELDMEKAKRKIERCLKRNYYYNTREWPYKNVKPRIIAEEYMVDESGYELKDYKIFTFNGEAKLMFIATDRNAETETCFDFFDRDFKHLPFRNGHPNSTKEIKKPDSYEEMFRLAEILGKDIPQARIDFYNINGKIYFGEITFFHWSGLMPFDPPEWDKTLGDWIALPEKNS